jgi:MarC family membrane protein
MDYVNSCSQTGINQESIMTPELIISIFVTLLVTIDPLGMVPIFVSLTVGMTPKQKRTVAIRSSLIALVVLAVFALFGEKVLSVLGITLPAFRAAGGLMLLWIGFEMVFEKREERKAATAERAVSDKHVNDVAAFPLAIPLMAGPGAITATMLIAAKGQADWMVLGTLIAIIATLLLLCTLTFILSGRIEHLIGETGRIVLSRLLGVILAALAVQYIADGVIQLART